MDIRIESIGYQVSDKRYGHLYLPSLIRAWVHEDDTTVEDLVIPRVAGGDYVFPTDISPSELMIALGSNDDGTVRLMYGEATHDDDGRYIILSTVEHVRIHVQEVDTGTQWMVKPILREYIVDTTDPTKYIVSRGFDGKKERFAKTFDKVRKELSTIVNEHVKNEKLVDRAMRTLRSTPA